MSLLPYPIWHVSTRSGEAGLQIAIVYSFYFILDVYGLLKQLL